MTSAALALQDGAALSLHQLVAGSPGSAMAGTLVCRPGCDGFDFASKGLKNIDLGSLVDPGSIGYQEIVLEVRLYRRDTD